MKIDRFLKIILVLVAGLLALNLARNEGPSKPLSLIETTVEAATPSFIQVGKRYTISPTGDWTAQIAGKVVAIDKEGWIQLESGEWLNLDGIGVLKEAR